MRELKLNSNGQTLSFRDDGTVAVVVDGVPTVKGKWRTTAQGSEAKENVIRYQIDGVDQPPAPVKYSFNDKNQLVAVIPAEANGGADSDPCVWLGKIVIDDAHDMNYSLLKGPTVPTNHQISVYGDLHFDDIAADLVIDLTGGGTSVIKGEKGSNKISQLTIGQSDIPDFDAKDLLGFQARTLNDFPGLPASFPNRADIAFTGKWDIDPDKGGIVFLSKIAGTAGKPSVAIGFAGQFKAVAAGFEYVVNNGESRVAFTVAGSHQWSSADASFKVSVGFSKKVFLADISGTIMSAGATGPQFNITGRLNIKHEEGKGANFALQLEGKYEFDKNKRLVFRADVSSADKQLNYDLMLEGKFVFKKGELNFQAKFSKAGPKPETAISLSFEGNEADLRTKLALTLGIKEDKVDFSFEFELSMRFKGGVLIKDKPKALNA